MDQVSEPSYATLSDLEGREVGVVPCVLDGGDLVPLTLECLTTPVRHGADTSFSVLLTGPAGDSLGARPVPGPPRRLHLRALPRVVRAEMRFMHYEAYLTETAV